MRAARYYGKEDIRIEQIDEAPCGEGQVRIAPAFVGICGTDLHEYLGGPTFAPTSPHPVTGDTIPITFGHEFSGVVKEIGKGVKGFQVGQNVAVQPTIYCRTCQACTRGVENACYRGGFIGLSGGGGGLSDSVVVPVDTLFPLPSNVSLDIGALVEPLSVAWHAISAAPITPDSTVLVLGGGPIGLAVVQCLSALKTKKIIVSEVSSSRQAFAGQFGAHHVLNPKTYDLVAMSKELSGADGPDVVFDCAGVPASIATATQAVRVRGTIVNVAIWEKAIPFQPNNLVFREAIYKAVLGYQRKDFQAVIDHIANGTLKPERMITSKIKLEDLVEKGFLPLINNKEKHVKILVDLSAK
ncbi:GroES-like protein [Mytilinidion resinicola]|uniref:GroES-like protein n=1 Tax=Mytilinidion resinicola TaxID=574789 RepID=A0A6A6YC69_9PEZI|nr:GroES-like protein [Mytilinidion resinicola]KAF2806416.1 GroES-like protein [Mytilinidion resinicola]